MNKAKRVKLCDAILNRPPKQDFEIIKLKEAAAMNSNRSDWLWHLLLSSMSTMGNSRGYEGLILNEENYTFASYATLLGLDSEKQLDSILQALKQGKVRRYKVKGRWLAQNFSFIQDCGGVEIVQDILLNTKGKNSKIKLMRLFNGIGDKYARNIFMDMHHEDFVNSIAVDGRLSDILDALEVLPGLNYSQREEILVRIANDCNISPWHLDRLLYLFLGYYIERINIKNV